MKVFMLLLVTAAFAHGANIRFRPCSGSSKGSAKVSSVSIEPCTNPKRCELKKGGTSSVTIKFTPTSPAKTLTSTVWARVGTWLPYPLPKSNACKYSGVPCPLRPNEEVTYSYEMEVKSIFPKIKTFIEWYLKDESSIVVCVMFPVEVV